MALLLEELKQFFQRSGWDKTYWVAYSGGLDSHVLLHLLRELRTSYPLNIRAIHINHGLSPHALSWEKHCESTCKTLEIDFFKKTINITSSNKNIEEQLRDERYRLFAETLKLGEYLLTAHHLDDQAETVLLQLLRGSGVKGLAAMPPIKSFAKGVHARPFLNISRKDLEQYAIEQKLCWIEDESNHSLRFTRNFLRHDVLPILKKRWPTVNLTLARTAKHCAETQNWLNQQTSNDLQKIRSDKADILSIQKLLSLDSVRQRHVLRFWFEQCGFSIPSAVKMKEIQDKMLSARSDKNPLIKWGKVELRRYRDYLYVMPKLSDFDRTPRRWDFDVSLHIPSIGTLEAEKKQGQGLKLEYKSCEVRFRSGGERCYFAEKKSHRTLKNLFQEWGVPPWLRSRMPLIFIEDQLVQVPGFFLDERFKDEIGYFIHLL